MTPSKGSAKDNIYCLPRWLPAPHYLLMLHCACIGYCQLRLLQYMLCCYQTAKAHTLRVLTLVKWPFWYASTRTILISTFLSSAHLERGAHNREFSVARDHTSEVPCKVIVRLATGYINLSWPKGGGVQMYPRGRKIVIFSKVLRIKF